MLLGKEKKLQKLLIQNTHNIIIFILVLIFAYAKDNYIFTQLGDHAIFAQSINNIINSGLAKSNIFSACQYLIDNSIAHLSMSELNNLNLPGQLMNDRFLFSFHADFILYFIAVFSLIFGSDVSLIYLQLLNIVLLFIFGIKILKRNNISKYIILIFVFFTLINPLIVGNILGQFYPDRLYIAPMFLMLFLLNKTKINYSFLLITFLITLLINERAAIYVALSFFYFFLIKNYEILKNLFFHHKSAKVKKFNDVRLIFFGLASILYFILIKFYLISNIYYGSFIPGSFSQLFTLLGDNQFQYNIFYFILNITPFLVISFFDKKLFILSLIAIIPNLIGNIGGAEKLGWFTHYHSYYIPFLFFSSVYGLISLMNHKDNKKFLLIAFLAFIVSIYFLSANKLYSIKYSFNLIKNIIVTKINEPTRKDISIRNISEILKPGNKVSTTELGMNLLHNQGVDFYYFPIQHKGVDFIFIPCLDPNDKYYNDINLSDFLFVKKIDSISMCFYKNNV